MKLASLLILCIVSLNCRANDGAFLVNGNQLIPMYETDVSVKQEILTIKRINKTQARITVYYEFFNPKQDKTLEVGFEAYSPSGDANNSPDAGGQPYISDFTVNLNGADLPWHVVIVNDSNYYKAGKFKTLTVDQAVKKTDGSDDVDFFYVYHFKAQFHQGVNILRHTYVVDLSSSIVETYSLRYVLTAAKRWANRQIDDFTLQIDMGGYQDLSIPATFFRHASEWTLAGKRIERKADYDSTQDVSQFFVRNGPLVFKKTNFKPAGELDLSGMSGYWYYTRTIEKHAGEAPIKFDYRLDDLPFSVDAGFNPTRGIDDLSGKIMRNLPFARRGYIFKTPEIQAYYNRQPWYTPDPSYVPDVSQLTLMEQRCLNQKPNDLISP